MGLYSSLSLPCCLCLAWPLAFLRVPLFFVSARQPRSLPGLFPSFFSRLARYFIRWAPCRGFSSRFQKCFLQRMFSRECALSCCNSNSTFRDLSLPQCSP